MPTVSQSLAPRTSAAPGAQTLFNATEYQKLSGIFKTLLGEVRESVINTTKPKTKVQILDNEFSVKKQGEARDTGRRLVRPADLSAPAAPPTKLVLTNTRRTAELQQIEITIPTEGAFRGKVSLITVTNKDDEKISFAPGTKAFIRITPGESGRMRITEDGATKE